MRLQQVYEKFKDRADFYWVYVREAHASDSARPSPSVVIATHRTAADREKAATGCQATLALKAPVLVDDMQDTVARAFNGWPDRLFLLSTDGKIAYRGGIGPWGLNVAEMEAALARQVGEAGATAPAPERPALPYRIVDTAQAVCYDDRNAMNPPEPGQACFGQDAQFRGPQPSYRISADGLTAADLQTGLTWQRSPETNGDGKLDRGDKLSWEEMQKRPAQLNAAKFGGFDDWRLPSIKELYSLFDCRGTDPGGYSGNDTSGLRPFLDAKVFTFVYGDTSRGERIIDSQYASSNKYLCKSARGFDKVFGVNFPDGRIKGYDLQMPGGGMQKKFFVLCVRGNPAYGKNDFHDNGDGTITDRATSLVWSKKDSGRSMNWREALAWVQEQNKARWLGHDDWRLPDVKELQSIIDYTRAPDATHSPAIDPLFECTPIRNEIGQEDFAFYWTSTTHASTNAGASADYLSFGRCGGWMSARAMAGGPPDRARGPTPEGGGEAQDYRWVDVHGAGSQRSDPKEGDARMFPHGRGPQGDVIRILNFVRPVRGGEVAMVKLEKPTSVAPAPVGPAPGGPAEAAVPRPAGRPPGSPVLLALDLNGDGTLNAEELAKAPESLKALDRNHDGRLTADEFRPQGAVPFGPP